MSLSKPITGLINKLLGQALFFCTARAKKCRNGCGYDTRLRQSFGGQVKYRIGLEIKIIRNGVFLDNPARLLLK